MIYYLRKVLGYVLTWFVPSKKWRHIIRDIVIVDQPFAPLLNVRRLIKCRRAARGGHYAGGTAFLAVCAIAKDEGPYFKEWIEYHRLAGVEKFYIYDNNSTDGTQAVLRPYIDSGLVEYVPWPGERQQVVAYNDCLRKHDGDCRWLAYIDLDEFIVPVAAATVPEALRALPPNTSQVEVGWVFYGSAGHQTKPAGPVTQSYMQREKLEGFKLGKCFVHPATCWRASVHRHYVTGPTATLGYDALRINHYYCKSWAEYQRRRERGDANRGNQESLAGKSYTKREFDALDRNDVHDPIMERWAEALQQRLVQR